MDVTLNAAYIALEIGPFIALFFSLPYTIFDYIKTKSVDVWKCTYFYIFCLYSLCAYFVTWLPLPTNATFELLGDATLIQLVPFQSFMDITMETFVTDWAIIIFNVILTMPLGYFMKTLFNASLKKTALAGFLVSFLYEVTQLTGLFFIYPRSYRIFDVDDLIINTLGAILGFVVAPLISKILPAISDRKNLRLHQGSEVGFSQRIIAYAVDFAIVLIGSLIVISRIKPLRDIVTDYTSLWRFPVYYALFIAVAIVYTLILGSNTLGYRLLRLRLLSSNQKAVSRFKSTLRIVVVYTCVVAIPFWVLFFRNINSDYAGASSIIWVLISALLMMWAARNVLEMMFNAVTNGSSMFYDRLLKTYICYDNSRKTSLFGIRVIDIKPLCNENVDSFSQQICDALYETKVDKESITKARLFAEGVMLDWIAQDLEGTMCELRYNNRFAKKSLMLSVPGENKTETKLEDTYVQMLSGMGLSFETYYAGEKNICIIHIL